METNIKLRLLGLGKSKEVKPLNDEMAMELGAEMLGEIVVFGIGAFTLWLEYKRQQMNENKRETSQFDRLGDLEAQITNLDLQLEEQRTQTRELTRLIHSIGDKSDKILSTSTAGDKPIHTVVLSTPDNLTQNTKKYDGILYSFCVLATLAYMYKYS